MESGIISAIGLTKVNTRRGKRAECWRVCGVRRLVLIHTIKLPRHIRKTCIRKSVAFWLSTGKKRAGKCCVFVWQCHRCMINDTNFSTSALPTRTLPFLYIHALSALVNVHRVSYFFVRSFIHPLRSIRLAVLVPFF